MARGDWTSVSIHREMARVLAELAYAAGKNKTVYLESLITAAWTERKPKPEEWHA